MNSVLLTNKAKKECFPSIENQFYDSFSYLVNKGFNNKSHDLNLESIVLYLTLFIESNNLDYKSKLCFYDIAKSKFEELRGRLNKVKIPYEIAPVYTYSKYEYKNKIEELLTQLDSYLKEEISRATSEQKTYSDLALDTKPLPPKSEVNKIEPIKWHGTIGQLIYIFEMLQDKNYFSMGINLQSTIRKHFVDKEGKPFTSDKQKSSKQGYLNSKGGKPKKADKFEQIITDSKKEQ